MPVPPKELPLQYLRVDSRFPYSYTRQVMYECSYPNDTWSCADATDKSALERWYGNAMRWYGLGWYGLTMPGCFTHDRYNGTRIVLNPHCSQCGHCNSRRDGGDNDQNFPAGINSYAYFCSGQKVHGKWMMQRVFYKDFECQSDSYLEENVVTIPQGNISSQPAGAHCSVYMTPQRRCSSSRPVAPQAECRSLGKYFECSLAGSRDQEACKNTAECMWFTGQENITGNQEYQVLQEPGAQHVIV